MKWIWNERIVALSNAEAHFLGFLKEEFNLARAAKVNSFLKQCLHQGNFFHNLFSWLNLVFLPNLKSFGESTIKMSQLKIMQTLF